MNWFILAILSAIFWGTENFLHKVSAKNGFDSAKISTIFGITVCVLSLLSFFIFKERLGGWNALLILALLNAITFFSSFITRLEALKRMDASIFFPIAKTGTLLIMVIISFAFLRQYVTLYQGLGLILTLLAIYLLSWSRTSKINIPTLGIVLIFASALFAALANFTTDKLELYRIGTYSFSFFAYTFGFVFSYILSRFKIGKEPAGQTIKNTKNLNIYILGVGIGILNFLGLVFFIQALRTGAFSIVGAINNFSLLLTITLSMWVYNEKVNIKQVIGIVLAFISLFLFGM